MNQIIQMMNLLQNNPKGLMGMMGNNPTFQRALQMAEGKNEEEVKTIIKNLADQRGISVDQLNLFLTPMGYKL